jgi:hypothetical protein
MKDGVVKKPLNTGKLLKFPDGQLAEDEKRQLAKGAFWNEPVSKEEYAPPPWLFQHQDLNGTLESAKIVDERFLKNKLNYIHFMDKYLLVLLRHPKYDDNVIIKVKSGPCLGNELNCEFLPDDPSDGKWKHYAFLHLIVDDGQSVLLIPANLKRMDQHGFSLDLPQKGYAVGQRRTKRYPCKNIGVELIQRGLAIRGYLLDFSPEGFCVRLSQMPSKDFDWSPGSRTLNMVHLRQDQQYLFSGFCKCIRYYEAPNFVDVVLAPAENSVQGLSAEKAEETSSNTSLMPAVIFDHPFFEKKIQLDVTDISTSGFALYERKDEGVLMQGMIIPELTIEFAGAISLGCSAQVTSRLEMENSEYYCYFCILDMDINSYSQLSHVLANANDCRTHISNKVAMDELWEFFFESGFIYPEKYGVLSFNRDSFKETYEKLYRNKPEISKHFTYQRNGRIYGHISMVRAYERAWMIHHHAARSVDGRRAGFSVLKQVMLYLNDVHRLPSAKMDYAMSFFRPENKFPDRVFGGFARELANPEGCSMDLFSYFAYSNSESHAILPKGWRLVESSELHLWELDRFYSNLSGGLLTNAIGIKQNDPNEESLREVYGRYGFLRNKAVYSLLYEEELYAVMIVDQSELGFNLSELLNGIKVFVIEEENLPWKVLSTAIAQLLEKFSMSKVPLLLYPSSYATQKGTQKKKQYNAWVLNVRYGKEFMLYMRKKFRL